MRHGGPRRRVVGPVRGFFCDCAGGVGPVRASVDPRAELRDLVARERLTIFARRRHLRLAVELRDEMQQAALGAFAGDDHRAGITALERALAQVEAQSALLFLDAVTLLAVLCEQRLDVAHEIHRPARGGRQLREIEHLFRFGGGQCERSEQRGGGEKFLQDWRHVKTWVIDAGVGGDFNRGLVRGRKWDGAARGSSKNKVQSSREGPRLSRNNAVGPPPSRRLTARLVRAGDSRASFWFTIQ